MTGRRVSLAATLLAAAMVSGPSSLALADDVAHCTVRTLGGLYVFSASGYTFPASGPAQPKAIVEVIRFNGDGTLTVPAATRSVNGVIGQSPPGGTGTYTVADLIPPDDGCSGHLTFTNGPSFEMFIQSEGEKIWMIQTDTGNVFQGLVKRVSR
jgi:hypothetical protein